MPSGASWPAHARHPGYRRMFAPDALTLGIFLPLRFYEGDMRVLAGQSRLVSDIDARGFAAAWVRDIPLYDPRFGDAGQLFDPFAYLAYLAARTQRISLVTGSAIFSLRHPIDLAKAAATIDQLSGGRLVMGIASGDRPIEFPAYGLQHDQRAERFAQAVADFRRLLQPGRRALTSPLGHITDAELLPKPAAGPIPCSSPAPAANPRTGSPHTPTAGSPIPARPSSPRPQGPGPENPGLARPHPRRRLPPSRHQRMDRPGRRPHAPAHPAARRFHPADRPPRAHRSALAMADCRRQPRRPGHPVLTPPRRRSHPGIGGSAAALPSHEDVPPLDMDW